MACTLRAIFYLTYNGVFNNTNGIGTQTKTFLAGMARRHDELQQEFGPFAVHLVSPCASVDAWGYSSADLDYAQATTSRLGGAVHFCPFRTYTDELWAPQSWLALSIAAATVVLETARQYDQALVIANDIPFLQTPLFLELNKHDCGVRLRSVIALYGTAYIHRYGAVDEQRVAWEDAGLGAVRLSADVKLGHVGDFMRRHLGEQYAVPDGAFVPYRSSLCLDQPDFDPLPHERVRSVLDRHGIPADRDLVLAFGRADWIKGFDILLRALAPLRERVQLVLNVVPYEDGAPILDEYRRLIELYGLRATLLTRYSRELPRALSQWRRTRTVVCPSRGEPLSNIPFEVPLWARDEGPVLLCANVDGFTEQIEHGQTGFLFASGSAEDLTAKLTTVLGLDPTQAARIRAAAYQRVVQERDFARNFRETLQAMWGGGGRAVAPLPARPADGVAHVRAQAGERREEEASSDDS